MAGEWPRSSSCSSASASSVPTLACSWKMMSHTSPGSGTGSVALWVGGAGRGGAFLKVRLLAGGNNFYGCILFLYITYQHRLLRVGVDFGKLQCTHELAYYMYIHT